MVMDIVRNDFEDIWKKISLLYHNGPEDRIFNRGHHVLARDSFQAGKGYEDQTIFFRSKAPLEGTYRTIMVADLFHVMNAARLLGLNKPEQTPVINMQPVWSDWNKLSAGYHRIVPADWYDARLFHLQGKEKENGKIEQFIQGMAQEGGNEHKALLQSIWSTHLSTSSSKMPEAISLKSSDMKNETASHNERQFNRLGMADLYTAELKEKLKAGDQRVEHNFQRSFDGVPATGTVYLSKGKMDNDYFINKFSLSKNHDRTGFKISQTFFVNNKSKSQTEGQKEQQQWTLKRAFNFLAGRPVFDRNSKSWNQINLNEKLTNGNYATQRYGENYGVDLDKIVNSYNITARGNDEKMKQIKEGLERGNLQAVQFNTAEGGKETYKIALSVRTGSLRIYDKDNKEVTLEKQGQKKSMVLDELIDKLIEVFSKNNYVLDQSSAEKLGRTAGVDLQGEKKQQQGDGKKNMMTRFFEKFGSRKNGHKHR